MTPAEYTKGVLATEAPVGPVLERLEKMPGLIDFLAVSLAKSIAIGEQLDKVKKAIFYGRLEDKQGNPFFPQLDLQCSSPQAHQAVEWMQNNPRVLRLLHSIVGVATEAAEMESAFADAAFHGKTLDLVNMSEEYGDLGFYFGLGVDSLHTTFEQVFDQNNKKLLGVRYKAGKFTEDAAINRDLDAERAALEEKQAPSGRSLYKPCQHCGATDGMELLRRSGGFLAVQCCFCGFRGPEVFVAPPTCAADKAAFDAWNNLPPFEPPVGEENEAGSSNSYQ